MLQPTHDKAERSAVIMIVDALLAVYLPAPNITEADELLSTSSITERLEDVLPFEVFAADVKEALDSAGFLLHHAGQMDFRWMLKLK